MRRLMSLALVGVAACAGIVGIEDDLPALVPGEDAGTGGTGGEAGPDASDAGLVSKDEHVPCEQSCVCNKEPVAGAEDAVFKDLPPTSVESPAVLAMHAAGVVSGCESTPSLFCPACQISRSVLAKWIVLAKGDELFEPPFPKFPDVPKNHPEWVYVETAFKNGYVEGFVEDGTFRPQIALSRASAAVILAKAAGLALANPPESSFTDVSETVWYGPYVEAIYDACITTGCSSVGPKYCPDKLITRRGAAVMVAKAFGFVPAECTPDPPD